MTCHDREKSLIIIERNSLTNESQFIDATNDIIQKHVVNNAITRIHRKC